MPRIRVDEHLAQKIVEAVEQVCACPTNFINDNGIIIASTDKGRVGTFHEAGYISVKKSEAIIVENDNCYKGAKRGANYPIYVNGSAVAAIGITGEPCEVQQFGFLATKITEVFIKEQQINLLNESRKQQINYVIRSYIYNMVEDEKYIYKILDEFKVDKNQKHAVVLVTVGTAEDINILIEKQVRNLFEEIEVGLNTYIYPNEFVGIVDQKKYSAAKRAITHFCNTNSKVRIGIGSFMRLNLLYKSYETAKAAINYGIKNHQSCCFFEDLNIEMIIVSLSDDIKKQYASKILDKLEQEEKIILETYFDKDMNLKETAAQLYLHINTLQYKLDKVAQKLKLNPRVFKEAVSLYMALLMR